MKALSIKQPWAWLICKGIKDVENRTWYLHMPPLLNHPSYAKNVPMRIYVHASKSRSDIAGCQLHNLLTPSQFFSLPLNFEYGAIIGEIDIVGCRYRFGEENDNLYSKWHKVGMYGFLLANPILYDKPIPCKGRLGFFESEIVEVTT